MTTNPFPSAAGYGNFPNGKFSPDLFAKNLLMYNQQISIVDAITNNEYEGLISAMGDTIHIRQAPQVSVKSYTRGQKIEWQDIDDAEITMVIDKANTFGYKFDDIFLAQKDVDYEAALAESAKYELRDAYDRAVLTAMVAAPASANTVGSTTISYAGTSGHFTPVDALGKLSKLLNDQKAPQTNRFAVMGTDFFEMLQKEAGLLADSSKSGAESAVTADLGLLTRKIHGFTLFMTTNMPAGKLLAGTTRAYATASQILKTEVKPLPDEFGYGVAGLHVFGTKTLRSTELAVMTTSIS
jgi:hypothetical protein